MFAALICALVVVPGEGASPDAVAPAGEPAAITAALARAKRPTPKRLSASIRGSIEASLVRLSPQVGASLAAQTARLLRWKGDIIMDIHPRDQLRLLYEPGEEPLLLAIDFAGRAFTMVAFGWPDAEGVVRYYDRSGALVEPLLNQSPADYVQITEVVQQGQGKRRHRGIDFKAPTGTPVRLPYDALIKRVNWATRSNGLCVEVIYESGPATGKLARFLHLDSVDPAMKGGARLAAGTAVGTVGSTGRSSAPHLHYEIRARDGSPLDPLAVHGTDHPRIPEDQRVAFATEVARLVELLGPGAATN